MALNVICPHCRGILHVREEYAGQQMKCPRCSGAVTISAEVPVPVEPVEAVAATVPEAAPAGLPTRTCPACGQQIAVTARKCRHCMTWLDEEDEDEDRGDAYKPCPRCGARGAQRVLFTFWGSFYGPALFTHVRCPDCGYAYNGRTGRSNLLPAVAFVGVPLLLIVAILAALGFVVARSLH